MSAEIGRQRVMNALRTAPLVAGSKPQDLAELAASSLIRHLPRGQNLFNRHEACAGVYVVLDGLVKLVRGGEQVIDIAARGRTLGLTALLMGGGYPFDAVSIDDCEVLVVQAGPLRRFLEQRPERLLALATELALRHEHMMSRVEQLIGRTAVQRVASYLLESAAPDAAGMCPPALLGVVRRADVAGMLGLTPETFSRVLARFRRAGFIRDQAGVVEVVDHERLAAVVHDPALVRGRESTAGAA